MPRPVLVVHHARSGVAALNVVSAALDADARTAGTEVRFAKTREEVLGELVAIDARGEHAVCAWSFYSLDFPHAAADLAWVRERAGGARALHIAGGVHATAEPRATLRAGFDLVALGEGESTIIAIMNAVAQGEDPAKLTGTAHFEGDRFVSHGPGARRPLDAFPAFNARYGKWNPIEITRGCVYACTFCQTPFMFKARFRHRSVANVHDQLALMAKEGVNFARSSRRARSPTARTTRA
jgi:radical SAM superfamily enzyme YgiQ (UPF0313 family)